MSSANISRFALFHKICQLQCVPNKSIKSSLFFGRTFLNLSYEKVLDKTKGDPISDQNSLQSETYKATLNFNKKS